MSGTTATNGGELLLLVVQGGTGSEAKRTACVQKIGRQGKRESYKMITNGSITLNIRKYPFIILFSIRNIHELRESLLEFYKGDAIVWGGLSILSWLILLFKPLRFIAPFFLVLSVILFRALLKAGSPRIGVFAFPIFILGTIIYYLSLAYVFYESLGFQEVEFSKNIAVLVLFVMLIHVSADVTFFIRSLNALKGEPK